MFESLPALHPVLVHFTIALLITAALLLFVARVFVSHPWAEKCRQAR
jgi:uncharacterized membrane protein